MIEVSEFDEIPFVKSMSKFNIFFLLIFLVSIARVAINIVIFQTSIRDASGLVFLRQESYAVMTELGSCLILFLYI